MTEGDKVGYEFFVWDKYGEDSLFFTLAQTKKAYREFREYQKQQEKANSGEAFIVPKPEELMRKSSIDFDDEFQDDLEDEDVLQSE